MATARRSRGQSANDKIADLFTEQAVRLERAKAGASARAVGKIDSLLARLRALTVEIDPTAIARSPRGRNVRVARLIAEAQKDIAETFVELAGENRVQLRALAKIESATATLAINNAVRIDLATKTVPTLVLNRIVAGAQVEGGSLFTLPGVPEGAGWWQRQSRAMRFRFAREMRDGMQEGATLQDLTRRLRGTEPFATTTKAQVSTLVRTSYQQVSHDARMVTYQANTNVIKGITQISTLDDRTSDICISYSGMSWTLPDLEPIGGGLPYNGGVPRHFNCRSAEIPITKSFEELSGKRLPPSPGNPSESVRNRFERNLRAQGLSKSAISRARTGVQSAMNGQVSEDLNFESWLRTRPVKIQRSVLGPARFEMWKKGQIELTGGLVNQAGRPLTLEQLARKNGVPVPKAGQRTTET